jgi:outer membrane protein
MYGITDNLSVNFDVIYMQANIKATGDGVEVTMGTGKTFDFSLGAQWRFMPQSRFVPYVGVGFDVLLNKFAVDDEFGGGGLSLSVATTYGGHVSVGADFFFTPNIALNAEIRGLYSTKGDITADDDTTGTAYAKYNPSNIGGFIGIRFFFP